MKIIFPVIQKYDSILEYVVSSCFCSIPSKADLIETEPSAHVASNLDCKLQRPNVALLVIEVARKIVLQNTVLIWIKGYSTDQYSVYCNSGKPERLNFKNQACKVMKI